MISAANNTLQSVDGSPGASTNISGGLGCLWGSWGAHRSTQQALRDTGCGDGECRSIQVRIARAGLSTCPRRQETGRSVVLVGLSMFSSAELVGRVHAILRAHNLHNQHQRATTMSVHATQTRNGRRTAHTWPPWGGVARQQLEPFQVDGFAFRFPAAEFKTQHVDKCQLDD